MLNMGNKENNIPLVADATVRRLRQFLADVEEHLGVTLTIHDRQGIFLTPDGKPLLEERGSHRHPYCRLGRAHRPGWDQNCLAHCARATEMRASKVGRPFSHLCWKGVQEIVVPVMREGVHGATVFAGVFRHPRGKNKPEAKLFPRKVRAAYAALPVLEPGRAEAIGRILRTLGQGLLSELEQLHQLSEHKLDRQTTIRRFIHYHAHKPVRLRDLASALHLSPSRTSHLVKDLFGAPFQELLIRERIRRARSLLLSSNLPVKEIARQIGMQNEYYFNRIFKQAVGLPPGRYRRQNAAAAK